jgi:ribosome-binding protein aMBF1 (putative translation factor)
MTIIEARKKKGVSLQRMSREANIPSTMLHKYEHGLATPNVCRAREIADYLGISLDEVEKFFRKNKEE